VELGLDGDGHNVVQVVERITENICLEFNVTNHDFFKLLITDKE
jgi:hypothetical protein